MQNLHLLSGEVNLYVKSLFHIVEEADAYTDYYGVDVGSNVAHERHGESK